LFVNLVSNALKYSQKEVLPQITIRSEYATEAELAPFNPIPETNYYKITVADNGIGFPNEYKEVIFDAFKRLHGKDDYAGTGIGLAICKKIVINHNGFITSNSEVGKGSEFMIFLPDGVRKTYH
jgi:signal transduction histidine kinase